MGFLVNPAIFRIGINNYWKITWANSNKKVYRFNVQDNFLLDKLLEQSLSNSIFLELGVGVSHFTKTKKNGNITLNLYIYDNKGSFDVYKNDYSKNKFKFFESEKDFQLEKWRSKVNFLTKILISSLFWRVMEENLFLRFRKVTGLKMRLNVIRLHHSNVTPDFIMSYITNKLKQRYSLPWILRPILRDLQNKQSKNIIAGFKLLYAGRFTRKQIADYSWTVLGKTSLNSLKSKVRLSTGHVVLKYGVCGLKLWIDYSMTEGYSQKSKLVYPFIVPVQAKVDPNKIELKLDSWRKKYLNLTVNSLFTKKAYEQILKFRLIRKLTEQKKLTTLTLTNSNKMILTDRFDSMSNLIEQSYYE